MPLRNVTDTSELYTVNRPICRALWQPCMSEKGCFFSQAPVFIFLDL